MEKLTANVKVNWVAEAQGGKASLPLNVLYYVITEPIRGKVGEPTSWSLVLDIKSNSHDEGGNRIGLGKASFLVEDAPDFLLTQGFTLNVYEGSKFVAIVEVL